jgi:hypothetical protein
MVHVTGSMQLWSVRIAFTIIMDTAILFIYLFSIYILPSQCQLREKEETNYHSGTHLALVWTADSPSLQAASER